MRLPFEMIKETEIEQYRAKTFWTKEPETIEWIKSFKPDSTFYDIGANIGVYSLYAASLYPAMTIYAFEPHAANAMRFFKNIERNGFVNIRPFPCAIGHEDKMESFYIKNKEVGSSGGQLASNIDENNERFIPVGTSTVFTFKIDTLTSFPLLSGPDYIKIDIDGQEDLVIAGARETLKDPRLKSVLVEINGTPECMMNIFRHNGFTINNRFNSMANHSTIRRRKEGIKARNVIFTR